MFKVSRGTSSEILKLILQFKDAVLYQLRKQTGFPIPSVHSVFSSTESLKFLRIIPGKFCHMK